MTANEPDSNSTAASGADRSRDIAGAKTITLVVYALQAASFLVGVTWIAAVIINYIKKEDVAGTWLESHFRWQIRTFWYGLLYGVIGGITFFFIVGWLILMADLVWVIYRIVKGWLRLSEGKPMYVNA
jgi:uncharacterized membrane protein